MGGWREADAAGRAGVLTMVHTEDASILDQAVQELTAAGRTSIEYLADSRPVLRSELGVDDATWERGRGWAISMAAQAIPYYVDTNPIIVQNGHRMIEAILSEA